MFLKLTLVFKCVIRTVLSMQAAFLCYPHYIGKIQIRLQELKAPWDHHGLHHTICLRIFQGDQPPNGFVMIIFTIPSDFPWFFLGGFFKLPKECRCLVKPLSPRLHIFFGCDFMMDETSSRDFNDCGWKTPQLGTQGLGII